MKNMNDGRRVARVEREVQSVISTFIIQRMQRDLPGLITVTRVQIPADLRQARVFVSMLQANVEELKNYTDSKDLKVAVGILQDWAVDIQEEIGKKLDMKYLPKLTFFPDESTDKILKIEKLISEMSEKTPKKTDEDDV